jgi:hypothetical protein
MSDYVLSRILSDFGEDQFINRYKIKMPSELEDKGSDAPYEHIISRAVFNFMMIGLGSLAGEPLDFSKYIQEISDEDDVEYPDIQTLDDLNSVIARSEDRSGDIRSDKPAPPIFRSTDLYYLGKRIYNTYTAIRFKEGRKHGGDNWVWPGKWGPLPVTMNEGGTYSKEVFMRYGLDFMKKIKKDIDKGFYLKE